MPGSVPGLSLAEPSESTKGSRGGMAGAEDPALQMHGATWAGKAVRRLLGTMGGSCGSRWSPGACHRHPNKKPRFPHPTGWTPQTPHCHSLALGSHASRKRKLVGQAEVPRISLAESGLGSQHVFGVFWTPSSLPLQSMQRAVLNTLSWALPGPHPCAASFVLLLCLPSQLSFLDAASLLGL